MMNQYNLIKQYISNEIGSGNFKPGCKLPSIRSLAEKFNVCNTTVIHAYKDLEYEHILYSIPKSGYYVVKPEETDNLLLDQQVADFASASPGSELLPYIEYKHCLNQAIDFYKESLFTYSDQQGFEGLRDSLTRYFQHDQIFTSKENIVITSGTYQGLQLLAGMPFPNGNANILVEQPTYYGFLRILNLRSIKAIGIERNHDGIDLNKFESILRSGNIKFFYMMSRFQNPTGFSYTAMQKKDIVYLAAKYNVYIVEDDYLGDLEINSKNDPIFADGSLTNTVYLRSFSKTFLPGIRIGAVILPKLLMTDFMKHKRYSDVGNNTMIQAALQIFIKAGMLDKHRKAIKRLYREKMECLKQTWSSIADNHIELSIPETGFFAYMKLPDNTSSTTVLRELMNHNIYLKSTEEMFLPCFYSDNTLCLSICRVDEETINNTIYLIAQCVKKAMNMPQRKIFDTAFKLFS